MGLVTLAATASPQVAGLRSLKGRPEGKGPGGSQGRSRRGPQNILSVESSRWTTTGPNGWSLSIQQLHKKRLDLAAAMVRPGGAEPFRMQRLGRVT